MPKLKDYTVRELTDRIKQMYDEVDDERGNLEAKLELVNDEVAAFRHNFGGMCRATCSKCESKIAVEDDNVLFICPYCHSEINPADYSAPVPIKVDKASTKETERRTANGT